MLNKELYLNKIADRLKTNSDRILLYWKGRVALYAILKGMGIKEGDEVIVPGFTCVVVPNAIKYLGAKPVYVDVNTDTLNTDAEKIKNVLTTNTKAIICQNTFGLSSDLEAIIALAKEKNLYTIEDCAHGFGGKYNGKPNGVYCDAAFYSTQWNKPFSTGIGGFALINNVELLKNIKNVNLSLAKPSKKEIFILSLLLYFRRNFLNKSNYQKLVELYRHLSKYNIVVGSSGGDEIAGTKMPKAYFKGISELQIKEGLKSLERFDELLLLRKKNAKIYTSFLKENGKYHVAEKLFENHSFLKYPIFVKDRKFFETYASKEKIELGNWFCSPIHPVSDERQFACRNLDINFIPNSYRISKQIVNLPTDTENAEEIISFLKKNIECIV